ncbi:hypothetical protein LCGC14_2938030 [marine sediment metagenome]|uniref:Uncharacterized protein n=1 Tax=marine sediment metagenome TaxID=412755 RepID=A0A0F8Y603_9ZZZZ
MAVIEPQPQSKRKPAPKKAVAAGKKRLKVSRMGYYIIIFGWLTIAVNFLLAFEWVTPSIVLARVMSAELDAFAFRAIALIIPLIFSILGYMVYQREKLLWRAIATGRKLEHMNVSLQTNYEKLAGQMSEKDKSGLTDQAIDEIKCIHRQSKKGDRGKGLAVMQGPPAITNGCLSSRSVAYRGMPLALRICTTLK